MYISISPDGINICNYHSKRVEKGKSLISFPDNFVVLDLETTGLDSLFDEIIEIAMLKVKNGKVVDSFESLIKPSSQIDSFIEDLTGITNEMLSNAPSLTDVLPKAKDFIGKNIILGHNVNFDINFLYDAFEDILDEPLRNDFVDTLRLARKALPELKHHRLNDIAQALNVVPTGAHRALADCQTTFDCFFAIKNQFKTADQIQNFINTFKNKSYKIDLHDIVAQTDEFDETHPLYKKHCVFTGVLEKMKRADAAQLVVNLGGICDNNVTKKTNFLILGNNDYCKSIRDGKSSKQKKAEALKLKDQEIEIIPEDVFYEMVNL